jgi:hypothetical protein
MEVRDSQPENAPSTILVTLSGITMEAREVQQEIAPYPIVVTLLGIVMEVKLEQS